MTINEEDIMEEEIIVDKKLMNRSLLMIISFFLFLIFDIVLFSLFQSNELFMFNLGRSQQNIPNPLVSQVFSTVFYIIIILATVVYLIFLISYIKKTYNLDYNGYKKIFNFADFFSVVPIFLFIIMIINGLFFSLAQVDGESMEPTFCPHDTVIINYQSSIERNDILIVKNNDSFLIKRVVGVPGDTIKIDSEGIEINGVLIETYLLSNTVIYDMVIPEGYYYVLGDNREHSLDSRFFGMVDDKDILGEVVWKLTEGNCE